MLIIKNLKKSYGVKNIFDDASMVLGNNTIAGLVGVNGTGKSTLCNIITGKDNNYEGYVGFDSRTPLIGYMEQEIAMENFDDSLIEFIKTYVGIAQVEESINQLLDNLQDPTNLEKYGEEYELFEKMGGYEFESRAEKILNSMGLGQHIKNEKKTIKELSGGERNKLLLCASILKGGDLLLLDEPTNNLDQKSINALAAILKESNAACLVISHDKNFLNKIASKIFELDGGRIVEYSGNYNFYQTEKETQYNNQLAEHERQAEKFKEMELAKRNLQDKARSIGSKGNTRDNDKGDGASKVAKKLASQAKSIKTRIERTESVERPKIIKELELHLQPEQFPEGQITIKDLEYSHQGNNLFKILISGLSFSSKDKILIEGENGQGKTTFIKLLQGVLKPDHGVIEISPSIKMGVFSQDHKHLPGELTAMQFLQSRGDYSFEDINFVLAKLGFEKEDRDMKIAFLSPGLRARLVFASLSLKKANCLIFDEPTNHIDIQTGLELIKAINSFTGMVLVVSHDKEFVSKLNFTRKILFVNGMGKELYV